MSYIAVDTFGDEYIYPFKRDMNWGDNPIQLK